jgi:hypothetical protein
MKSYQSFIPGNKFNSVKKMNYIIEYNYLFNENKNYDCVLQNINTNTNTNTNNLITSYESTSSRMSSNMIKSQLINNNKGGTTQYGESYLNKPLNINYLGRTEGMPGGGGKPPKNKF